MDEMNMPRLYSDDFLSELIKKATIIPGEIRRKMCSNKKRKYGKKDK